MSTNTIPLKAKYTLDEGLRKPNYKAGQAKNSSNKRCAICGYTARKNAPRGYIHPKCRAHRKDGIIRVLPRGGPMGGRHKV